MLLKTVAATAALVVSAGLSVTACGGGDSNASVCNKIIADSKRESSSVQHLKSNAPGAKTKLLGALKAFAGDVRSDVSNASTSGLKSAGGKVADGLDKAAADANSKDPSVSSKDEATLSSAVQSLQKYCPKLGNSSS